MLSSRTVLPILLLVSSSALVLGGCGGGEGDDDLPDAKPEWKQAFAGFPDLSAFPMVDTSRRYTPATVKTLEECGAGKDELEEILDAVERGESIITTTDGTFGFALSGEADPDSQLEALTRDGEPCELYEEVGETFSSGDFESSGTDPYGLLEELQGTGSQN